MYEFASHPGWLCLAPVYRKSLWCLSSLFMPPIDEYLPDPLTNWPFREAHPFRYLFLSTHPSNVVLQWTDGLARTGKPFPLHYLPICTHQCQKTQQSCHKQSYVWLTPCKPALEIFAALGLVCFFSLIIWAWQLTKFDTVLICGGQCVSALSDRWKITECSWERGVKLQGRMHD